MLPPPSCHGPLFIHNPRFRARVACGLLALSALPAGCYTATDPSLAGPVAPAKAQVRAIDVQVFRDDNVIRMTNTTARVIGAGHIWVNSRFSHEFKGLGVGESVSFDLGSFRDQYGEAFRAGGFFAAKRPDRLVLAQIETGDEVLGLIVVADRSE